MNSDSTYLSWLKSLPADDLDYEKCLCPNCGSTGLQYQYFGFSDNEFCWKLVWCTSCDSGIRISRTKIPSTANPLIDDGEQEAFLENHSHIKLIA